MPALPLTPSQLADAARLRALYAQWKDERRAAGDSYSQETAAALLGFNSQSSVSQYVNGRIPLNVNALLKFADLLNIPPEQISPDLALEMQRIAGAVPVLEAMPETDSDLVAVRKIVFKISAGISGFSVDYLDNGDGGAIYFARDWLERRGLDASRLYATRVGGLSMYPKILEDDIVVVNTADVRREHEALVAANHEGEFTVKRLKYDHRRWWLASDNPDKRAYPAIECDEGTYVLGRVVHLHREL